MGKKKCEFCGEAIHINTKRCPFCGSIVSEVPKEIILPEQEEAKEAIQEKEDEGKGKNIDLSIGDNIEQDNLIKNSKKLTNNKKVLITAFCTIIPGIGQLAGIIIAIMFMSEENDIDKREFGKALLTSSITVFCVLSLCCLLYSIFSMRFISENPDLFKRIK